ncbi:MAG TPA: TraB/GumN family protein [Rhodanobacteraceae bacterium]
MPKLSIPSIARHATLVLLLCLTGTASALAGTHPALWKAGNSHVTVYFFGTVHVMKKGVQWHFPALDKALHASGTYYMETTQANPAMIRPLVMQYGFDPAHPLSSKIGKKENALLKQAAKQIGLPGGAAMLEMMKPWMAAITIATAPLVKAGFDPKLGVDKQLQARFKKAGKPVKGFETAKQQILFIATLPEAVQIKFLGKSLHDYAHANEELKALMNDWLHGDVPALARIIVTQMKDSSPKVYQALIVNRNHTWAKQIAKLMKTSKGTFFVAVGAGHLVGPDRLQVQLARLGIQVKRVDH